MKVTLEEYADKLCKHTQIIRPNGEKAFCTECGKAVCSKCGFCFDVKLSTDSIWIRSKRYFKIKIFRLFAKKQYYGVLACPVDLLRTKKTYFPFLYLR